MAQNKDYLSFDEVLGELNLRSAELKKLMSEGQIRGIRDGDNIKFRKEEVDSLSLDASGDASHEELLFVEEDGLEEGMATAQISEEDTLLDAEPEIMDEDIELPDEKSSGSRSRDGRGRSRSSGPSRTPRTRPAPVMVDEDEESTLDRVLIIATSAICLYGVLAIMAAMAGRSNGMTQFLADMFK